MKSRVILSALCFGFLSLAACTAGIKRLAVTDVWARPGSAGENSAVYFTIENETGEDDKLLTASSDIARAVEIHSSMMDENDVMVMEPQESVPVPAGESVEFKPGGLHVMLIELAEDLEAGDSFSLLLTFEKIGTLNLTVKVQEP